jgi:putative SOS response-associated peptidase YedK
MCGRLAFFEPQALKARYGIKKVPIVTINYNFAPGMSGPVVTRQSPKKIKLMKWGLIPSWVKEVKTSYKMINGRAETILEKVSFRKPFSSQRCLVPANGFYEWQRENGKQAYYFSLRNQQIMSFAGLFDIWRGAENEPVYSFTILTVSANKLMKPIHDRMPVILKKELEEKWLDNNQPAEELIKMLKPYQEADLIKYPVSREVNQVVNNDEGLIQEIS